MRKLNIAVILVSCLIGISLTGCGVQKQNQSNVSKNNSDSETQRFETETDSYDYKGELENSINSVLTAVEDSERSLKESPERRTKKSEKRLSSLRALCEKYETEMNTCEDYKKLLEDYRRELDEINSRYR